MTGSEFSSQVSSHWREATEALIVALALGYAWILLRGTRAARVLAVFSALLFSFLLLAEFLDLHVGWLLHNLLIFLFFSLIVLFQPELRRALASAGSHRLLSFVRENRQAVDVVAASTFDLANRQLGALIALERDGNLDRYSESGVLIDAELSQELVVTIFHPKTPLHDGGLIIRDDRILSAASIFPISQRGDLDRNLGLRHRAGLGLSEDQDAVVIVVSEETGIVSICHDGKIERNFDPESFKQRLSELLRLDQEPKRGGVARDERFGRSRRQLIAGHEKEAADDRLAF